MHYVKVKGILSAHNNMNIYRGCTHGCIYCDSRSKCYQMNHEFTDIEVKENAIELLELELSKKRKKIMVSTGAMTDPYLHLEKKLEHTRKALQIIYKYGHGVTLQTKSDLILRDLELIKKINNQTRSVIQMTLTTADDNLCRILEPNVCVTSRRVEVLKTFAVEGIETIVWLCPFIPLLNDTLENLKKLLDYCLEAKVSSIICFGIGLTLREGNREYFYQMLDIHFPGLKNYYIKTYQNSYEINSLNHIALYEYFKNFCLKNNIEYDISKIFKNLKKLEPFKSYRQLSLF